MDILSFDLEISDATVFEHVPVSPDSLGHSIPRHLADKVMVDVIHDGNRIPSAFLDSIKSADGQHAHVLNQAFVRERDWGAELVAQSLAQALHLSGYYRVNIARCLLDFGRFPGSTQQGADHLNRSAINHPFSDWLSYDEKRQLLEEYYDQISLGMDVALAGKVLKIAIHTYDKRNPTAFERPAVSVLTRPLGHQNLNSRPFPNFDPSFPSRIVQYTADRLLRARLALTLEEAGIHAADNFPYSLPEGSVEVRAQVWYFYRYLREHYNQQYHLNSAEGSLSGEARNLVWTMLMDTNLRSSSSQALRSYLHHFRTAPRGSKRLFSQASIEYEKIRSYIADQGDELITHYERSLSHPSTIIIEVRKDLVWSFDKDEKPIAPKPTNARRIARTLAIAVQQYLLEDRQTRQSSIAGYMSKDDMK